MADHYTGGQIYLHTTLFGHGFTRWLFFGAIHCQQTLDGVPETMAEIKVDSSLHLKDGKSVWLCQPSISRLPAAIRHCFRKMIKFAAFDYLLHSDTVSEDIVDISPQLVDVTYSDHILEGE